MSKASQAAQAYFTEGYNCAQSVLIACGQEFGLPKETAVKVAGAFGGGIARTGNTCGAVTGALMAIGLKRSAANRADAEAKKAVYTLANDFMARFKARNESIVCRDLLGCDLATAHEKGLTKTMCPKFVKDAVEIVQEMFPEKEFSK